MSTHIFDQVAAAKIPKARSGYVDDYYVLATLGGDNNCFDSITGLRARSWCAWRAGQQWHCLQKACEMAASFCGGCARFAHGPSTPEGFIRKCRQALDTAPDYDSPQCAFRLTNPAITFTEEEKNNGQKWDYARLLERGNGRLPEQRDVYLRGKVEAFPFDFSNPRMAAEFIELLPYNTPLWHHVIIRGAGEI